MKRLTLENGVELVVQRMPGFHSVATGAWVRAGSRAETDAESGSAHFLEHLLFKGTESRNGEELKRLVEGVGGLFNAYTGEEATCYYTRMPLAKHLDVSLDALSDMIRRPTLPPGEVARERNVIIEEIRMCRDIPPLLVEEAFSALLFPGHPLGRAITGTPETMGRLSRDSLLGFWSRHYTGASIVVSIAGDVEESGAAAAAAGYFGTLPGRKSPPVEPVRAKEPGPDVSFFEKETEQVHFLLGGRAFPMGDARRWVQTLLAVILGGSMCSRLALELREKRGLAYHVSASAESFVDTGIFAVSAGTAGATLGEALRVIRAELARIAAEPVGEEELGRARDYTTGQLLLHLESSSERVNFLGEQLAAGGDLETPEEAVARINSVTAGEVAAAAREIFDPANIHLALVGPRECGAAAGKVFSARRAVVI